MIKKDLSAAGNFGISRQSFKKKKVSVIYEHACDLVLDDCIVFCLGFTHISDILTI